MKQKSSLMSRHGRDTTKKIGTANLFPSINIIVPKEKIYRRLGYRSNVTKITDAQKKEIEKYIKQSLLFIHLKGITVSIPVKAKNESIIELKNGIIFKSRNLSAMLKDSKEVLLIGATAGKKVMEEIDKGYSKNNLLKSVVFDASASEMVDSALDWMMDYCNKKLCGKKKKLTKRRFSAGYGDLFMENQKVIYEALQLKRLNVNITDNFMLIPEKSVTAIAGIEDIRK